MGFLDRKTAADLKLGDFMKERGPVYESHWLAWKDKEIPNINLPMDRYLQEVMLETCCLGMLGSLLGTNAQVRPIVELLVLEVRLKAARDGYTDTQLDEAKKISLIDHYRVFPHPPELTTKLKEEGFI